MMKRSLILCLFLSFTIMGCSTQEYRSPWLDPNYDPYDYNPRTMEDDRNFPNFEPVRPNNRPASDTAHAPMSFPTKDDRQGGYLHDNLREQNIPPSQRQGVYSVETDGTIKDTTGQDVGQIAMAERPRVPSAQRARTSDLPPVKVGVLLPLSGRASKVGESILNAAQLAMFDVAQPNVSMVVRDTKGTPEGAREAAQSAIDEGAQIILGPLFSQSVKAAGSVARQRGVNVIGFSTDWTAAGNNVFIMGFLPFTQVSRVVDYAVEQGYREFAGLIPKTGYGAAVVNSMQKELERKGIPQADIVRFAPTDPNISPIVRDFAEFDTRIQSLDTRKARLQSQNSAEAKAELKRLGNLQADPNIGFDAVMLPLGGVQARKIASLLQYFEVDTNNIKLLGTGLWDEESVNSEIAMQGAWFAAPDPDLRREFERKYFATYSERPERIATLGYDAMALASVLAYSGTQQNGQPAFHRSAITGPNGFAGIDGIFRFRPDGLIERGLAVLEVRRTGAKTIDPAPRSFAGR